MIKTLVIKISFDYETELRKAKLWEQISGYKYDDEAGLLADYFLDGMGNCTHQESPELEEE